MWPPKVAMCSRQRASMNGARSDFCALHRDGCRSRRSASFCAAVTSRTGMFMELLLPPIIAHGDGHGYFAVGTGRSRSESEEAADVNGQDDGTWISPGRVRRTTDVSALRAWSAPSLYRSDDVRRATAATNSSARARDRFNSGEVFRAVVAHNQVESMAARLSAVVGPLMVTTHGARRSAVQSRPLSRPRATS